MPFLQKLNISCRIRDKDVINHGIKSGKHVTPVSPHTLVLLKRSLGDCERSVKRLVGVHSLRMEMVEVRNRRETFVPRKVSELSEVLFIEYNVYLSEVFR